MRPVAACRRRSTRGLRRVGVSVAVRAMLPGAANGAGRSRLLTSGTYRGRGTRGHTRFFDDQVARLAVNCATSAVMALMLIAQLIECRLVRPTQADPPAAEPHPLPQTPCSRSAAGVQSNTMCSGPSTGAPGRRPTASRSTHVVPVEVVQPPRRAQPHCPLRAMGSRARSPTHRRTYCCSTSCNPPVGGTGEGVRSRRSGFVFDPAATGRFRTEPRMCDRLGSGQNRRERA
jgi:hypothetical protein